MAVPFNMPDEQCQAENLINQIQTMLSQLKVVLRQIDQLPQRPTTTSSATSITYVRVRSASVSRQRLLDNTQPSSVMLPTHFPELISNLSLLASSANTTHSSSYLTHIRSARRRTSSESSNCDETKTTANKQNLSQDWNKIDCIAEDEDKDDSSDGLLSKIMPASVSSCSLMTAVICFVGWHIFRAR